MEYKKAKPIKLKDYPEFSELWLQQKIVEDVELLGLGAGLVAHDIERRQPRAGRIDLLLSDPMSKTRYVVEIQLGDTDESHIIRTLEYWDIERRRFPQYEHVAVIVAEAVTGRFYNVINLFNRAIPLIAIQMSALEMDGAITLHAATVLNLALPAVEEEDEPGADTDRAFWAQKSSPAVMGALDKMLEFVNETGEQMGLKYNKEYIGLHRNRMPDNFVELVPRKQALTVRFRITRTDELDVLIEDSTLIMLTYDTLQRRYTVSIRPSEIAENTELLRYLVQRARGIDDADLPIREKTVQIDATAAVDG